MDADVDLDAVALLVGELVLRRAAVVRRDRVAARLGGEAGLGAAVADHLLDRFEHVAHTHAGLDVGRGPFAALTGDATGATVTLEGVGVHAGRAFYAECGSIDAARRKLVSRRARVDRRPAMRSPLLMLALLGAGCRTVATRETSSALAPEVRIGARARTWEVRCGTEALGYVVLFQEHGLVRDSVYVVRNAWNQDLGLIDGLGRAYRYVPHEEEPAWVGSGTIALGAERILGAHETCALVELETPVLDDAPTPREDDGTLPAGATARPAAAAVPAIGLPQSR